MSDHRLWNLAKKSDKAGVTQDKVERPDLSGLGVRSLEPGLGIEYVRSGDLVAEESG
jgi:hypothetical protein